MCTIQTHCNHHWHFIAPAINFTSVNTQSSVSTQTQKCCHCGTTMSYETYLFPFPPQPPCGPHASYQANVTVWPIANTNTI